MRALAVGFVALLGACYSPNIDRCRVTCEDSNHCPGAQLCLDDHFCHEPADVDRCDPDAEPAPIDAAPDAGPDAEPTPVQIRAMTLGGDFGCAIDAGTHLICWGYNRRGAVGAGTAVVRIPTPLQIGTDIGWTDVDAGDEHVCGIRDGELYCWGADDGGETNDGVASHYTSPTPYPSAGTGWLDVTTGRGFSCGIRDVGGGVRHLFCWGANELGQLGNGSNTTVGGTLYEAVASDGAHDDWATITAGVATACATRDGGEAYCWGANNLGQVGDGTDGNTRTSPTRVVASTDVGAQDHFTAIAPGYLATCALGAEGGLYCWGNNTYRQLGVQAFSSELSPRRVGSATDWSSISVYFFNACGSRAGGVFCWGDGTRGALGDGGWDYRYVPTAVVGLTTSAKVSVGYQEACAALSTGGVRCWGENGDGELGTGVIATKHTPVMIAPAGGWTAVRAGTHHTCGIHAGEARCWGWDDGGQVSGASSEGPNVPTAVTGVPAATEIATGTSHSCALADDGGGTMPWCWGTNSDGQIGQGAIGITTMPLEVGSAGTWHDLAASGHLTCALNGTTRSCWGLGSGYGQGNGSTAPVTAPTAIADGAGWVRHAYGHQFGCGVQTNTALACWGIDSYGTQGDAGTELTMMTPQVIDPGIGYAEIATWQNDHACAIQTDGDLACWGRNDYGQCATSTGSLIAAPVVVTGTGEWSAIATGALHSCGVKDGGMWCWGNNFSGQIASDASDVNYAETPTRVGSDADWTRVTTGAEHTCAIRGGDLYCWGGNVHGQIGDGTSSSNTPQATLLPSL